MQNALVIVLTVLAVHKETANNKKLYFDLHVHYMPISPIYGINLLLAK